MLQGSAAGRVAKLRRPRGAAARGRALLTEDELRLLQGVPIAALVSSSGGGERSLHSEWLPTVRRFSSPTEAHQTLASRGAMQAALLGLETQAAFLVVQAVQAKMHI